MSKTTSWLEKLSDSERETLKQKTITIEFDKDLEREQAEIEAIKRIIQERTIIGKCDICERVHGCMLTTGQRPICGGQFKG